MSGRAMSGIHALLRTLGAAGVLGIGVLVFCVPFYVSAVRPLEREVQSQRAAAERVRTRSSYKPVSGDARADELRRFYALFPPLDQLPGQLERIYGLARDAKLELLQGEYRLERPRGDGLVPYRITLPMRGAYPQVRDFVGATLQSVPNASIDALRFERKNAGDVQLDAQVRLTVYFRPNSAGAQ
jgi:hypothetical protein